MVVVVQDLAAAGEDRRIGHAAAARQRQAFHRADDLLLDHAGPREAHGQQMHLARDVQRVFDLGDFLIGLHCAQRDHGLDQHEARAHRAEQRLQRELRFRAVRRQHVDRPRQRAGPHSVVDIGIVGEQRLFAAVGIEQQRKVRPVEPAEVREARVLPEVVGVVAKVHRAVAVAEQQDEAGADALHQRAAALRIGGGGEHRISIHQARWVRVEARAGTMGTRESCGSGQP